MPAMKVNEQLAMLLLLEKSKASKDGKMPITLRLTIDSKRAEMSLGHKVEPEMWNQEAGKVSGNSSLAQQINTTILRVKSKLKQLYDSLASQHEYVSAAMVKEAYQGKKQVDDRKTLLQTVTFIVDKLAKKVEKGTRAEGTWKRWRVLQNKVESFIAFQYQVKDMLLEEVAYAFAEDFLDFLMLEQDLGSNTAMKYVKNAKHVFKTAVERDWLLKNPISGFKCTYVNPDRDILNDEEIMLLYNKKLPIARLAEVRDVFLFMCFTGYAFKDTHLLSPEHVVKFFDGEDWIMKNRQKTWCRENVPLLPIAKEIIDRYRDHPVCINQNSLFPIKSNQKFNSYLKEIMDICGIEKDLTSHIARHTFATTITLANGVPIETVSALLGHKSIRTTQIYAKIVALKISADMLQLKQKLDIKMPLSLLKSEAA
jgi:site-specific recombinase XerD